VDPLVVGRAILDAGGWAAFLGLGALIAFTGARRGWVFGWMWERLEKRAETAETQAERNADSLDTLAQSYEVMARSYDRLERDFDRIAAGRVNRE